MENTDPSLYRLTVICDGYDIPDFVKDCDHILWHADNLGLGPSINQALAHIDALNKYYESSPDPADCNEVTEFVCYCQDDLLYSPGWLETLAKFFLLFERQKNLGFASGVECIEHEMKEVVGEFQGTKLITKDWIRAAQVFGRRDYWMSMFPIPAFDPETGRKRAKPNDGMGSGVDWHFIRNHENSVCKSGKTCLVLPGLVKHMGYDQSTWLDREMPESNEDKRAIRWNDITKSKAVIKDINDW